jgi:hypothetical protein
MTAAAVVGMTAAAVVGMTAGAEARSTNNRPSSG